MTRSIAAVIIAMAATMTTMVAAAPLPVPKVGQCPSGYHQSGGFCAPTSDRSPAAIPKGKGQCPTNWTQSGAYCIEVRRPRG